MPFRSTHTRSPLVPVLSITVPTGAWMLLLGGEIDVGLHGVSVAVVATISITAVIILVGMSVRNHMSREAETTRAILRTRLELLDPSAPPPPQLAIADTTPTETAGEVPDNVRAFELGVRVGRGEKKTP